MAEASTILQCLHCKREMVPLTAFVHPAAKPRCSDCYPINAFPGMYGLKPTKAVVRLGPGWGEIETTTRFERRKDGSILVHVDDGRNSEYWLELEIPAATKE